MINLSKIKKRIKEDWLNSFPELSPYNQNSFYKICGCKIIGIELIRIRSEEKYRPYFVCYSLSSENIKECLKGTQVLKPLKLEYSGNLLDIPYSEHSICLPIAIELMNNQIPVPLKGDIYISVFRINKYRAT